MASSHPEFKEPTDRQAILWRYMDFTKYVALLEAQALYFCRADRLGDPFEGSISQGTIEMRKLEYAQMPPEKRGDHSEEIFLGIYSSLFQRLVKLTFINCWHMNDGESVAMWRLYAPSNMGVAVRTSFAKLFEITPKNVFLGVVRYTDYDTAAIPGHNLFAPYVFKRKSFVHENEVRAVIQYDYRSTDPTPDGLLVPISLQSLFESIHVSPNAPIWFVKLVKKVTARYGLELKPQQSQIDSRALF